MDKEVRAINKMIETFGRRIFAMTPASPMPIKLRAMVQDYSRRRIGRYSASLKKMLEETPLGSINPHAQIIYAPYAEWWDNDLPIRLLIGNKTYDVTYDSVTYIADDPLYVFAIAEPVGRLKADDYNDIGGNDNE